MVRVYLETDSCYTGSYHVLSIINVKNHKVQYNIDETVLAKKNDGLV